ncbi:acyl-CoA carboxylase subunit epsilon [Carbonactinospora thermoautotrophica]|uniref:acyl-CoA carboxylase subunit epsilon n=1 Tax=Carbonactinospora thermoautotrophica TaxID=1469144 RepID=UPI00099EF3CB|nr:acyl-CoA carboxylase subunit epsilon [Carbonactinospora thermoautotrophica]
MAASGAPLVRVLRGCPTPEEVAALITVLAARAGQAGPQPRPARPRTVPTHAYVPPGSWHAVPRQPWTVS